ncbi:MAG: hypothetical protein V6Z89_13260 [Desulfobacter sp.]
MNSLSDINSNGLQNHGNFASARVNSRELAVNSYESLDAGLTIQTREGDIVTLSASRFSEMDAYEYSSNGEIATENGRMMASHNVRQITLTTGETFSFSVQGNLNEQELADIEAIVKGVDEIIGEMAQGDMEDAVAKAMTMGTYDSVSMYQADISMERSYAMYAQTQSASYEGLAQMAPEELPEGESVAQSAGMSLLDKIAELLEKQEEEALARAQQPLGQLFAHHLNTLEKPGEPGEADESGDAEAPAAYTALETAADQVNQMISDMIKDIFKSTLDQIV